MLDQIKNKISNNSGLVNMVINLAILFWLIVVGIGVSDLNKKFDSIKAHQSNELENQEEVLKKEIINFMINQLQNELGSKK